MDLEESEEIDEDYILWETSSALAEPCPAIRTACLMRHRNLLKLSGNTNGDNRRDLDSLFFGQLLGCL